MKTYILPLVIFLLFMSCNEENPQPVEVIDPFVGSWSYSNPDLDLEVSFQAREKDGVLTFENINIEYPEISETETMDCHAELFYRFAVNAGYEEIKIFGSGDQEWIIITMTHNRIHLETRDIMDVYRMEINMINRVPIVLDDQVFERN